MYKVLKEVIEDSSKGSSTESGETWNCNGNGVDITEIKLKGDAEFI